jgi:hypothetical protein
MSTSLSKLEHERLVALISTMHATFMDGMADALEREGADLNAIRAFRIFAAQIRETVERHLPGRLVQ